MLDQIGSESARLRYHGFAGQKLTRLPHRSDLDGTYVQGHDAIGAGQSLGTDSGFFLQLVVQPQELIDGHGSRIRGPRGALRG